LPGNNDNLEHAIMNYFSIRDIENLCGIKAHTLRIWEQRYNLCVAKRKESQHRIYDNDDLKELLRVSFLYHSGHKISRIAELSNEQIRELIEQSCVQENNQEVFVHQLIETGLDFDKEKFEKIINCIVMRLGLEKSITGVFYPFLERIGLLWMTNHVIPAQEHFASHIIRKKIILAIDGLELKKTDDNIVVFAPEGEYHEIPLLTANYFFRKNNNYTTYFGINVPAESIRYYAKHHPVSCFYLHVITHMDNCGLEGYIRSLCNDFPTKQIVLSGPAAKCIRNQPDNLKILHSMDEMIAFAKMGKGGSGAV
jgi:MerR family transcriptional regulator, light-induced transcriptional regulator